MTYKSRIITIIIVMTVILVYFTYSLINGLELNNKDTEDKASVEFMSDVDKYGNKYTVEYYPEEEFCILSIYMAESKTHKWNWSNYENEITCNYITYQDDHYVVSFKPNSKYSTKCKSLVTLLPLEDDHTDTNKEYNSFVIEVGYPEEGGYRFNVYPAVATDTLELDMHDH